MSAKVTTTMVDRTIPPISPDESLNVAAVGLIDNSMKSSIYVYRALHIHC